MVKRKSIIFILMVGLMLAAAVLVAFPKPTKAAVLGPSVKWDGAYYEGTDDFYHGDDVIAFTENSTATVQFVYVNQTGSDIRAKPFVQMDWGTRYYGTEVSMAAGESAPLAVQFTVPTAATAGLVEHGYNIGVEYQRDAVNYNVESVIGERVNGLIGNPHTYYTLGESPIVADSLQVWESTDSGVTWQAVASTAYTLTAWTGMIDFGVVTTATDFLFNYSYYEILGAGDGVTTVFSVSHSPASGYGEVVGTPTVYIADFAAKSITATTAFSFDVMSGEVTLTTAPSPDQAVLARYSFYEAIPAGQQITNVNYGAQFVVYGADQAAAAQSYGLADALSEKVWDYLPGWNVSDSQLNITNGGDILVGSATDNAAATGDAALETGQELYAKGDFVGAKTQFDAAQTSYQAAIDAQTALSGTIESGVTGLITGASNWLDAQAANGTALADAQKAQAQAESNKANKYGTFLILAGVGVILVGVGGLLWGCSRVMGARKANQ